MPKSITIRDMYAGKPDAKDEVNFEGRENFIKSFVVAEHFNLDSLISGNTIFITGFKGTGKTALLFYLDDIIHRKDCQACTSYIFFKEDFTDARRSELERISRRVLSSIIVEPEVLVGTTEFEYIWRWVFWKQIVADNETYSRNLFLDDDAWKNFEKIVNQIIEPENKRKFQIPNSIKIALPMKELSTMTEITPELKVDFRNQKSEQYKNFVNLLDQAEEAFTQVTKTDIPYYLFIDELEAYYGDSNTFKRDLYMIRDLIFTVKRYNLIFAKLSFHNVKAICSIRTEIISAISRFIVTKEINKVISGFALPLNWNYSNSNSYAHPIIQILLKRISIYSQDEKSSDLDIYRKWFPEKIHDLEPANYILNNSWLKPRDMIRLIITAQNSLYNDSDAFYNRVFDSIGKAYSEDSLQEIKEELRALYTSEEIDCIIMCFTGFQTMFSLPDLKKRISNYFSGTVLDRNLNQILNDLYRLGVIGNYLPMSKAYRWKHRGDDVIILADEWRICVHIALYSALSLRKRNDYGWNRGKEPQAGDISNGAIVDRVNRKFVKVRFQLYGKEYGGQIHISEIKRWKDIYYIDDLSSIVYEGDTIDVVVKGYNDRYKIWDLTIQNLGV